MRNDGRFLLAVINSCVQIKIRVVTFDTNLFASDFTRKSTPASIQKRTDSVVKSAYLAIDRVDVSSETIKLSISLRLAFDCLHVTYIKDKQLLIFNFIFDLLWTNRGSPVNSVGFVRFRDLHKKRGSRR